MPLKEKLFNENIEEFPLGSCSHNIVHKFQVYENHRLPFSSIFHLTKKFNCPLAILQQFLIKVWNI